MLYLGGEGEVALAPGREEVLLRQQGAERGVLLLTAQQFLPSGHPELVFPGAEVLQTATLADPHAVLVAVVVSVSSVEGHPARLLDAQRVLQRALLRADDDVAASSVTYSGNCNNVLLE